VLKEEKVYVLKDKELRVEIIQLHYDVLVAGHEGRWCHKLYSACISTTSRPIFTN